MKPQPRRQTWGEEQRSRRLGWRAWLGIFIGWIVTLLIGIVVLVITIGIGFVVLAFFLGAYNQQLVHLVSTPPIPALIGVGMVALAAWGLVRVVARRSDPAISRQTRIVGSLTLLIFGLLGVAVVVVAITTSPDPVGF